MWSDPDKMLVYIPKSLTLATFPHPLSVFISVSLYHTTGAPGRDLADTVPVMQEDTSTKKTQLTTPSRTEVSHVPKSGKYIIIHN